MEVKVLNKITGTVATYEGVQDMGSLLDEVRIEFGQGVVKRPSPANAPGTGATVTRGAQLVIDQVLEWYPAAASTAAGAVVAIVAQVQVMLVGST